MHARRRLLAGAVAFASLVALASLADGKTRADCEREYTPQRGQEGKDVIWVPTEDPMVIRMLEMAKVTPVDKVYDLGAGDGKIAIAAGKRFGATAIGIEYDADLAKYAQCLVEAEGVEGRVRILRGDIFATDFSDATVVTVYLLPALNLRLRPTLLDMRPGTRVVSYSFTMGDWEPDDHADTDHGSAYLWIVPAKVDGPWTFRSEDEGSFDATLEQTFQLLSGSVSGNALTGRLSGASVELEFVEGEQPVRVTGAVDGDRMSVTVTRGGESARYTGTRE
ncbi:MAG TPA: class I SAM-dependent methyltransferase [Gammaproteobacteria bacterium]|nr:class I SAM-dependent methyltransferase [Gammaproteobacteria bacterium]